VKKIPISLIISFLGIYFLSAGISWLAFSYLKAEPSPTKSTEKSNIENGVIGAGLPKTEECPINGAMYAKPVKDIWETRRPITAMVENHVDARPLSGISRADVVYEAVAEGGITRFLGVFYCDAAASDFNLAVIRSARVYYINWAAEYGQNPIFLHWGGANNICNNCYGGVKDKGQIAPEVDAFKLLDKIGWRNGTYGNDMDGQSNIGYPALKRLPNRLSSEKDAAAEHQPTAYIGEVYKEAEKRGFAYKNNKGNAWDEDFVKWQFADAKPVSEGQINEIAFSFWANKGDYDVVWKYDGTGNSYKRFNGGKEFTDFEYNNKQVEAKNVLIQFVKEKGPVDKEIHMNYDVVGKGEFLLFNNGGVLSGNWKKEGITSRTQFFDKSGKEASFVKGVIWIEALPSGNKVKY
jgi:Protein of unknown function (DUF3048) N-terminal domain/Protein of unknown function (DUF3048) C-terminal domain